MLVDNIPITSLNFIYRVRSHLVSIASQSRSPGPLWCQLPLAGCPAKAFVSSSKLMDVVMSKNTFSEHNFTVGLQTIQDMLMTMMIILHLVLSLNLSFLLLLAA